MKTKCIIFAIMILFSAWSTGTGLCEPSENKTLAPYFYIENASESTDAFPLKETRVTVNISGMMADVVVTQKYHNAGTQPINARYIFPASTRAAVHDMEMHINDRIIKAKIKERKTAEKEFAAAKKQGKSASLLNQQRPNVFAMNVANLMPGDDVEIRLAYSEFLVPRDGTYEFVFPTVVGPRYSSQSADEAPPEDKWVQNPYLKAGTPPKTKFDITVNLSTGIPLQEVLCKTHKTNISYENSSLAKITLAPSETNGGNRDFILDYRLSGRKIESGLMLYKGHDENFFALMVQPPKRVVTEMIPKREYIFLVDVSGSMSGFPLNVSKSLLQHLIGKLRPTDCFNVVLFAGGSRVMAPSSLPASQENINRAITLINNQNGGGGTELHAALEKALKLPRTEDCSRTILIVTDGYIDAERQTFSLIANNLDKTNVFAFGIGSSVNRYLIEGMAKAGQGEPFIVTDPADASRAAEQFRQYIQYPLLSHIRVRFNGFDAYDVEPPTVPDLFAERPIVIFGKWRGPAKGKIEISGTTGNGTYHRDFSVADIRALEINSPLRYLWARTRIARLSDYSPNLKNDEEKRAITSLGLTYNLLTAYTSFIAVDETIRNPSGKAKNVTQPLPLPKNVSNLAVGGAAASVPEPGLTLLLLLIAGLVGLLSIRKGKRASHS